MPLQVASEVGVFTGLLWAELQMEEQPGALLSFQIEICTGAMFMRLVLGLDIYLVTIVLLTITGIYTITGEATLTIQVFMLTQKLCLLGESW